MNMNMKAKPAIVIIAAIVIVSALSLSLGPAAELLQQAGSQQRTGSEQNSEYITRSFDYGPVTYRDRKTGTRMPYRLNGTVTVPAGEANGPEGKGNCPVVIFLHGNHDNLNEKRRLDTGFVYAAQRLAQNGYAAVTLNIQPAYVWKYGDNDFVVKNRSMYPEFINALKKINMTGKLTPNGITEMAFLGKLDLNRIMLCGHSNGGEIALALSRLKVPGTKVSALVGLANTEPYFSETESDKYPIPDMDQAYIVSESDGDVTTMDASITGHMAALLTKSRTKPIFIVTAEHLNHNYFNSDLKINDAKKTDPSLAGREKQMNFFASFMVDYCRYVFAQRANGLFCSSCAEPLQMYGVKVKTEALMPDSDVVYNAGMISGVTASGGASMSKHTIGSSAIIGENLPYMIPLSGDKKYNSLDITYISYTAKGSVLIPVKKTDLSNAKNLEMVLAEDPSSPLNHAADQAFTLKLHFADGSVRSVPLTRRPALRYVPGKLIDYGDGTAPIYSAYSPLSMIRIPVSSLNAGAVSSVLKAVEFDFNKMPSGAIILDRIEIVR